ncbi:MAG: selenocysteine-specific translation elongation factor, partial [Actinomycetota bacterium]|nr:selenocysteine-specific translation elongation factor [Actinomycetota bacterium]
MPLTVGTAGHVDHGKTWLVRALTGKDTDRLPEEQQRGVSIDLGYAPLDLGEGVRLSLIDVPGHERFVRNMVAGATGIDLFLLVIDAGEGVRQQTREHLAILRLLGVETGVVALTKADAVEAERLAAAEREARALVPGREVVAVSAKTGLGLGELRAALARVAAEVEHSGEGMPTRLWIDRVFPVTGAGTVVTGTLWSGTVGVGDVLHAEPGGLEVRVRSVEVHDERVDRAQAGQRVAVGLPGVHRDALERGQALVEPGAYPVGFRLDVRLECDECAPVVTVHLGTAAVPARVVRVGNYAQLRLSEAVVAARGDRVVLRTRTTIGGGRVLDPAPPRGLDPERLALLEGGDAKAIVRALAREPTTVDALRARGILTAAELAEGLAGLAQTDNWYFRTDWLEEQEAAVADRLAERAAAVPLDPGIPVAELFPAKPWAAAIAQLLGVERRGASVYLPGAAPSLGDRADEATRLEA